MHDIRVNVGDDLSWDSDGCGPIRYIRQHHAHRSNLSAASDFYTPENLSVGAKFNVILKHRYRTALAAIADGHALAKCAVAPDLHIFVNKDIPEMVNPKTRADIHAFWDADSSDRLAQTKC